MTLNFNSRYAMKCNFSQSWIYKGLVIKYTGGGGPAEIGDGSSIFKLTKRGGSHVYRVGQVEIEQSSKTSLFHETESENLPRE